MNAVLHKVSRNIVDMAEAENAVIVVGDLSGIGTELRARENASTGLSATCLSIVYSR
jgi:IS605 OrfB family transposase